MNIFLNRKIVSLLMPMLFFATSALAVDISEYGDFSSRSLIINNQKNNLTQEQKDILLLRKLAPTTQCLIQQIKKNNIENVEFLLDIGLDPNRNYSTEYPIYIAAKENHFEMVKLLHEKGAKLDRGFYSELYEALKNKNNEMAQYLLDNKANIKYIDSVSQNTLLYLALKNNMLEIAQQLIAKGANVDRKSVLIIKKKKLLYLINQN